MTCNLKGRPVGLSPTVQFALLRGTDYWLYVEHAGSVAPRIMRIRTRWQARTFTFDRLDRRELDDTPDEGASDRCN